jgi:outer membrane protein assembly factor BamB
VPAARKGVPLQRRELRPLHLFSVLGYQTVREHLRSDLSSPVAPPMFDQQLGFVIRTDRRDSPVAFRISRHATTSASDFGTLGFMSCARRILSWSLFLGFLWAVGWAVFVYVRHTPRCVIAGPLGIQHLAADGSQLVTLKCRPGGGGFFDLTALQIWDLSSGKVVREMLSDAKVWIIAHSQVVQHSAVLPGDGTLWLLDWNSGGEWQFEIDKDLPGTLEFSAAGSWLRVDTRKSCCFVDVHQHRLVPTPKGNFLLMNNDEHAVFFKDDKSPEVYAVDLRSGRTVANGALGSRYPLNSSDGSLIGNWRADVIASKGLGESGRPDGFDFWDAATLKHRFYFAVPSTAHPVPVFSNNCRRLAFWHTSNDEIVIRFFDATQGEASGISKIAARDADDIEITAIPPDDSLWTCVCSEKNKTYLAVLDGSTGQVLWKSPYHRRNAQVQVANGTVFSSDLDDQSNRVVMLDALTGRRKATVSDRNAFVIHTVPNGRFAIAEAPPDRPLHFWEEWLEQRWPELFCKARASVLVLDAATGREIFRASGEYHPEFGAPCLSDDGSTLLTDDWLDSDSSSYVIKVWDVWPTKAYLWAIGAAAGIGIALVALNRLRRKLTGRAASTKQTPAPSAAA